MGNTGSSGNSRRRNSYHHHPPPPPPPLSPSTSASRPPPDSTNLYVFAAATPYPPPLPPHYPNPNPPPLLPHYPNPPPLPPHYPNPNQYYPPPPPQYPGYYSPLPPAMPLRIPLPFDPHHHLIPAGPHQGMFPPYCPPLCPPSVPAPYVEHQKAKTIRNVVNLKKETLKLEPDEDNPGAFLVSFTFDAEVDGSITILFFAKEGVKCSLMAMKENLLKPVTVPFKEGLGQKFRQPSGTGIDFSVFEEAELLKEGEMEVYPLAVKAEASPDKRGQVESQEIVAPNSQITQAVFDRKENDKYQSRVVKQILWMDGTRYELQEIYGIVNSVDSDFDGNDSGKECVICLSEPRDTTVLPCRHMCLCSECAKVLRYQTNRCPICRQPVERLLEIEVNNNSGNEHKEAGASRGETTAS